jgi:hypothetical protein
MMSASALYLALGDLMRRADIIVLVIVVASSMAHSQTERPTSSRMKFQSTSSAFASGSAIPREYSCEAADQSPNLQWSEAPAETVTFALIMDDPDAPSGDWVHWVVWNIPATSHGIAENFPRQEQLTDGTRQGRNSFGKVGYNGPCPPPGKTHRYFFHVYAVATKLYLPPGASRAELDSALKGHVLAEAEYMGTYRR